MRVWLSGALARPFVCGPVQGLKRWGEAELLAQATVSEATGLDGPCEVSLDAWPHPLPTLVVAMDRSLIATILDAARNAGVRIVSVRPWWAGVLERRAASKSPLLAARDTDALTVLAARDDAWSLAHSCLPRPDESRSKALLDRLTMAADVGHGPASHADIAPDAHSGLWPVVPAETAT